MIDCPPVSPGAGFDRGVLSSVNSMTTYTKFFHIDTRDTSLAFVGVTVGPRRELKVGIFRGLTLWALSVHVCCQLTSRTKSGEGGVFALGH